MALHIISMEKAKTASTEELTSLLGVNVKNGLEVEEASCRLSEYGFNEIEEKKESLLLKFLRNFWGPIPWMIEAAAILSAIIHHWEDFYIITFLLLLNAAIEFIQEFKAGNAIAALKERLASKTRVLRGGQWKEIEARELVPGDIIRVRLGDIIPADLKMLKGEYLLVDEAALTGESMPVEKYNGDIAYSGSVAKQGEMICLVYGTAENTFFGRTAKLVSEAHTESHFQKAVVKIGDYLIVMNFLLVSIVIITGLFRHESIWDLVQFALVLTVASIPAAMPAVLSVTMAIGALMLSKKEAIISKLVAIEEMAGMDILCSDKTGTITKNALTVRELRPMEGFEEKDTVLFSALASKEENHDPIDLAVLGKLKDYNISSKDLAKYEEKDFKPFDPVLKRTEALIERKGKAFRVSKGAPQVILDLCANKDKIADEVNEIIEEAGKRGYRALGVARTGKKGKWEYVGLICLEDPPREDSAETIRQAKELGVDVKMITGDHLAIAKETASQVNIGTNIFPAEKLSDKPDRHAVKMVEDADGFSQVFPEHKYEIVDILQKNGHIVGMTGDGVNDAPALKKADTGIAVHGATDAAKSAADIVFTRPGLSVIVDAIKESRRIFQRMQSYAVYRISETQDVLFFTVAAILLFRVYPVTAIMIVMLAVFNDFPIMAIAYDNAKYGNEPENWNMRKVIGIGTVLGMTNVVFTFLIFYIGRHFLCGGDWHYNMMGSDTFITEHFRHFRNMIVDNFGYLDFKQVQTLVFAELAIAGNLTVFLARVKGPAWSLAPGKSLVWATIISKLIVSLICFFGFFMAPIGWYIVFVWIYACVQMLITDRVKVLAYSVLDHKGIRFGRYRHFHK